MNIISWNNAGKRLYGERRWFWAVWIDVEKTLDLTPQDRTFYRPYTLWNHIEPTASGFEMSQPQARHEAWNAIRNVVPDKAPNAHERGWSIEVLWKRREAEKRPRFSRCKVGSNKWLWVAYAADGFWENPTILARGYASSASAAQEDAVAKVGQVENWGNGLANELRRKEAAIKRSQRKGSTSEAALMEFAYECHEYCSDYEVESSESITKHRIVKRTKDRIYVACEAFDKTRQRSKDWRAFAGATFILDRKEFEENGKAERRRRGWWNHNTYYSDPALYRAERRSTIYRPECFIELGVPSGATVAEVQLAYRKLACQTHPDTGGDAEAFKRIQGSYEEAMQLLGGSVA